MKLNSQQSLLTLFQKSAKLDYLPKLSALISEDTISIREYRIEATHFVNAQAPGSPRNLTFGEMYQTHKYVGGEGDANKWMCEAYAFCKMSGGRKDENCIYQTAIAFDFDSVTELEYARVKSKLEPFAYVEYTTFSHGVKKGIRRRIVLPFSYPVPTAYYRLLWKRLNIVMAGELADGATINPARLHYGAFSAVPVDDSFINFHDGALVEVRCFEGGMAGPWDGRNSFVFNVLLPTCKFVMKTDVAGAVKFANSHTDFFMPEFDEIETIISERWEDRENPPLGAVPIVDDELDEDGLVKVPRRKDGSLMLVPQNLARILKLDPLFKDSLKYDKFKQLRTWNSEEFRNMHYTELYNTLCSRYNLSVPRSEVVQQIEYFCDGNEYDSLQEHILSLPVWDGKSRISWLVNDVLKPETNNPLYVTYMRKFLISLMARALRVGEKVEDMLVLTGPQGAYKGMFLRALVGGEKLFLAYHGSMRNDELFLEMEGYWLVELQEMESMDSVGSNTVKAILSSTKKRMRRKFDRAASTIYPRAVLCGTANDTDFLHDLTGNRRFWVIKDVCNMELENIKKVEAESAQILAEAYSLFLAGEEWWLPRKEMEEQEAINEEIREKAAWDVWLTEYVQDKDEIETGSLWNQFPNRPPPAHQLGKRMRKLGFTRIYRKCSGKVKRFWSKVTP